MRIPIRVQLGSLLLLSSLLGLAVISIAVWITVREYVLELRASRLELTASLKAAQLASNLDLMQTSAAFVSTRILIQRALQRYNQGNNTAANWVQAEADMQAAIGGSGSLGQVLLLQTMVWGVNASGPGGAYGLLNTTVAGLNISLPYTYPNGTHILMGANDTDAGDYGFPPPLYPNMTFFNISHNTTTEVHEAAVNGKVITPTTTLLLGPWVVNETLSLISMSLPIVNNSNGLDVLGYITCVMNAVLISDVMHDEVGLDETAQTLILSPATTTNLLPNDSQNPATMDVRYILPLDTNDSYRHPNQVVGSSAQPFNLSKYQAVEAAVTAIEENSLIQAGSNLWSVNEAGMDVSIGWAIPQTPIVDWIVVVELQRSVVWAPITHLREIILACLFATAGFMAVMAFPLAHFASLPIIRLRQATTRSIAPPGTNSRSSLGSCLTGPDVFDGDEITPIGPGLDAELARKEGFISKIQRWGQGQDDDSQARRQERRKREFRIPQKVKVRRILIHDELSDLTSTFNEMSDELMMQYTKLEDRVRERTAELEMSKKAAEAANESKTLFIANISHELKTPLNGILGMCAVCMQEDDPLRLKRSLGIIYKSGDLLLNLLTDLLTFSKNQVGQQLSLDEKEFRLRDVSSQTMAIFEKQATEGKIDFRVEYEGVPLIDVGMPADGEKSELGPLGTGRIRDMILWGDMHRILQVVINLVSNSLKFTPAGGKVTLILRCLPEIPTPPGSRSSSMNSRKGRRVSGRPKGGSDVTAQSSRYNSATATPTRHSLVHANTIDSSASPPPGRYLNFEFEVQDTGPGIAESLQKQIFEPFVQGDLRLSKKFGGTGLGLSICSQLAQLMRGSIRVKSAEGRGATFTMKIPLRHIQSRADSTASSTHEPRFDSNSRRSSRDDDDDARHVPHPDALAALENKEMESTTQNGHPSHKLSMNGGLASDSQPRLVGLSAPFFAASSPMESPGSQPAAIQRITANAAQSGARIRVLVAEDNQVNQEVVLRMLKLEDIYDVTVARDGQEALDLVKESMCRGHPFNLIFMDVQMPNVDGLESTRLIREIGYEAPIVALTAFAEESNIKDCLDSGMNYFLSKPIRRPQLKKVLKEYCPPIPEENEDLSPSLEVERSDAAMSASSEKVKSEVTVEETETAITPSPPISSDDDRSATLFVHPFGSASAGIDEETRPLSPKQNL